VDERRLLDPAGSDGRTKNISFDPASGAARGTCTRSSRPSHLAVHAMRDAALSLVHILERVTGRALEVQRPLSSPDARSGRQ